MRCKFELRGDRIACVNEGCGFSLPAAGRTVDHRAMCRSGVAAAPQIAHEAPAGWTPLSSGPHEVSDHDLGCCGGRF